MRIDTAWNQQSTVSRFKLPRNRLCSPKRGFFSEIAHKGAIVADAGIYHKCESRKGSVRRNEYFKKCKLYRFVAGPRRRGRFADNIALALKNHTCTA